MASDPQHAHTDPLPMAAPCRSLTPTDPLRWLAMGWHDLKAAPVQSLTYGVLLCAVSYAVSTATWLWGSVGLYLGLVSGFVFVGPALAMTLYAISDRIANQKPVSLWLCFQDMRVSWRGSLLFAVVLVVVLLIWARAANTLYIFFPQNHDPAWADLLMFLGIGSLVGALFCLVVFAISAFSLPMMMERKTDAITAVVTSVNAVLRNKPAMAVWALLIALSVLVGMLTAWLGLIVTLPVIGHATWHGYRATIDASQWPLARPQD